MPNSRSKGKRGELMFRDKLREHGFTARRGQQFAGGPDSPDVICEELDNRFHFEVKNTAVLRLSDALEQPKRNAMVKKTVLAA